VIVPELFPLAPDVICSQLLSEITAAVQGIVVPVTVLETLNVVVPVSFDTSRVGGVTESTGVGACVTVTSIGLPVTSTRMAVSPLVAVIRMVAVRLEVVVLAE